MLSVQAAGCAGMERLGVPTCTTLNGSPEERGQFSCRIDVDTLQARELLTVCGETVIHSDTTVNGCNNNHQHSHQNHHHHHLYYQRGCTGSGTASAQSNNSINNSSCNRHQIAGTSSNGSSLLASDGIAATILRYDSNRSEGNSSSYNSAADITGSSCINIDDSDNSVSSHSHSHECHRHCQHQMQHNVTLRCPHHVPMPDSAWSPDRNLHIRRYQQTEITRSYIKPPPNKTVKDVPEETSHNCFLLTSDSLAAALAQLPHYTSHYTSSSTSSFNAANALQPQQQPKSKPSVITKLFSRRSTPKSPTMLSTSPTRSSVSSSSSMSMPSPSPSSSTSSLVSTSSSASTSLLSSGPIATLPISTASVIKTTACSYGASLPQTGLQPAQSDSCKLLPTLASTTQLSATAAALPAAVSQIERMSTPPLSVSIPIVLQQTRHHHHHHHHQEHHKNTQQRMLLDSIPSDSTPPVATPHMLNSGNCIMTTIASDSTAAAATAAAAINVTDDSHNAATSPVTSVGRHVHETANNNNDSDSVRFRPTTTTT